MLLFYLLLLKSSLNYLAVFYLIFNSIFKSFLKSVYIIKIFTLTVSAASAVKK